jgi:hypothetical protein
MIPAAPAEGRDIVFNPPPGWATPPGFDPRRGHLVDPAWPAAPADWQFWATRPKPRGLVAALKRGWWGPALGGLAVIALVLVLGSTSPSSPADGVGSCWAQSSGSSRFTSVDCSSDSARYRVSAVVSNPDACGSDTVGYFEDTDSVECLVAASH